MVVWIGTVDYMIRQKRQILGGQTTIPELEDATIKETLKQLNKEVTPEAVAEMKNNLQRARSMISKVKGNLTETYHDIRINPTLTKDAFRVALPKGLESSPSPF